MKSPKCISLAVAFLVTMNACAGPPNRAPSKQFDEVSITLPVRIPSWLNDQELEKAKQLALAGDLTASYCLAREYGISARSGDPERRYWILIAAENGDADAMTIISAIYGADKNPRTHDRADFWQLRAESTRSHEDVDCHNAFR